MKAILRSAKITPKKANLIAGMVRTKPTTESLEILKFTPKKGAKLLHKLLASAVANAVSNFKQDEGSLTVKEIIVTKGPTFKRGVPVSRGRVYPILKRTSNITVVLEVNEEAAKASKKSKTAQKSAETTEAAPESETAAATTETKASKVKPAKKSSK